ncbi:reverse transcriptase [Cucumis melo var. makuwa]|uniref:Reverse transcriptase n=1 Tax=Cucumis melo var. makuwa TaxID=1194695 RepID=A0A5A7V1W9_CUCMM|nr:reverse transcriptase [Cucumis melo var. makuwa]TYK05836.1 reverse transcriptase [Cucumis melo var. makuwa]
MCVLEKYHDVMPNSLPKYLPSRRMIDHEIELLPGEKSPAKNAYRMAPSKTSNGVVSSCLPWPEASHDGGVVLGIANVTKPFKVETNASDYALGGVLLQNGHLMSYESRNLNAAKKRYTMSEKEMLAVVAGILVEFDFEFKHKKESSNQAADALSQKNEHATMCMLAHLQMSKIDRSVRDVLREFLQKDPGAKDIMNFA